MNKIFWFVRRRSACKAGKSVRVPEKALPEILRDTADKFFNRPGLSFLGKEISYGGLDEAVDRLASGLYHQAGIRKGDRVGIMLPNCPQSVMAYYAALRLGAVVAQFNPLYTEGEIAHQLLDSGVKAMITLNMLYRKTINARKIVREKQGKSDLETIVPTDLGHYASFPKSKLVTPKMIMDADGAARAAGKKRFGYLKACKDEGKEPDREKLGMLDMAWQECRDKYKGMSESLEMAKEAVKQGKEGTFSFNSLLEECRCNPLPGLKPDDLAVLQYTGGTTGVSKAAMLLHRNLVANVTQVGELFDMLQPGKERFIAVLPLFHVFALTACQNFPISIGAEIILVPKPDPKMVVEAISKHKATVYEGSPTMYDDIVKFMEKDQNREKYSLSSLRFAVSGAAPLYEQTIERFEKMTGSTILEGYGLTEASPIVICGPPDKAKRVARSIGNPMPGTEAKIVTKRGWIIPIGEPGELWVRGPQVMAGYYNMPGETKAVLKRGGWLCTGDIAKMDENGNFFIVDREKNMICSGGLNIYPNEVEKVVMGHPAVMEAAAIGKQDDRHGEIPIAVVVLKEGNNASAADIIAHCKKQLAPYKVPKEVIFKKELPKSIIGKVLHKDLRVEINQK